MTPRFAFLAFVAWLAITLVWWALAFAPLPLPEEWLATARSVCFGTQPNGLPEPWGWATLVASPLAMLGFLLAVWGGDLARALRLISSRRLGRVSLAALLLVPLLGAGWVGGRVAQARRIEASLELGQAPAELPEHYPRQDRPAPGLGLVDQRGEVVSLADLEGRPVLLTFAFAHCRTICPVVVNTVKAAARELVDLDPAVVVVTLDPWRDTPSSLPTLHSAWGLEEVERAHVLSGGVEDVLAVLDAWEMPHERDPRTGDVAHPALVHVLDAKGAVGYTFNGPSVDWVVEAARRLG